MADLCLLVVYKKLYAMKYIKRLLLFILAVIMVCSVRICVYHYQDGLIFFPNEPADENIQQTPPQFQTVQVKTSDGLNLHALYFPGDKSKPAILWNHGNAYDVYKLAFILQPYIDVNFPVYMTEYRGFGGNPGHFSERGFMNDIDAGWQFLKSQGHENIVVHGYSMGCATSALFANIAHRPTALVLESSFTDLASVARHRYRFIPFVKWLLKYDMNTLQNVMAIDDVPILILHGDADNTIPFSHGASVYDASPADAKKFILIPGGTHKLYKFNSYNLIIDWLKENVK